jgi:transposase
MQEEVSMRISYPHVITESVEELQGIEQQLRGQRTADRVRMLRLLKSGAYKSLVECAPFLGYSVIQMTRWWEYYKAKGLNAVITQHPRPGKPSRMTENAWIGLEGMMREGRIATLEEARSYLEREWQIFYASVNGVWERFKQRKVKWKTGRRRHRRANQAQQNAFKKTLDHSFNNSR